MQFLERVIDLIQIHGITKNKLLADLHLNKSSFFDWERRNTIPSGEIVAKIADYFGVSTDYLLGRSEEKSAAMDGGINEIDPGEEHLVELYRDLNAEGQNLVVDYADTLVASGKYIKSNLDKSAPQKYA